MVIRFMGVHGVLLIASSSSTGAGALLNLISGRCHPDDDMISLSPLTFIICVGNLYGNYPETRGPSMVRLRRRRSAEFKCLDYVINFLRVPGSSKLIAVC